MTVWTTDGIRVMSFGGFDPVLAKLIVRLVNAEPEIVEVLEDAEHELSQVLFDGQSMRTLDRIRRLLVELGK